MVARIQSLKSSEATLYMDGIDLFVDDFDHITIRYTLLTQGSQTCQVSSSSPTQQHQSQEETTEPCSPETGHPSTEGRGDGVVPPARAEEYRNLKKKIRKYQRSTHLPFERRAIHTYSRKKKVILIFLFQVSIINEPHRCQIINKLFRAIHFGVTSLYHQQARTRAKAKERPRPSPRLRNHPPQGNQARVGSRCVIFR